MERSFWKEQGWEWDSHTENELRDEEEKDNKQRDRHCNLKDSPHDTKDYGPIEIIQQWGNKTQNIQEERVPHPVGTTIHDKEGKEPMEDAGNKRTGKDKKDKERKKKKKKSSRDVPENVNGV